MSATTPADSRCVTRFQCRSMNTKATTDCRTTIGRMMISSARDRAPSAAGLDQQPTRSHDAVDAAGGRAQRCNPDVERASWRRHQPVADAAHGLHEQRIGGIALDLAPQPVDLHVDRALAGAAAVAGQRAAAAPSRPGVAASSRSMSRSRSVRWMISSPRLQFAAREMKDEIAEAHRFRRWRWRPAASRLRILAIRSDNSRGSNGLPT